MASFLEQRADWILNRIDDMIANDTFTKDDAKDLIENEVARRSPGGQRVILERIKQKAADLETGAKKAMKHEIEGSYHDVGDACTEILNNMP